MKFAERLMLSGAVRRLSNRLGRSYWIVPRKLRRHLWWERDVSRLPNVRPWDVGPPETVDDLGHKLPASVPVSGMRIDAQGFRTKRQSVSCLDRAWLVGRYASPVTLDGHLILSAFRDEPRMFGLDPQPELGSWMERRGWLDREPDVKAEHVWSMVNRLQTNYFHWLVEWCGRLQSVEQYAGVVGSQPRLLIPSDGPAFIRESLSLLGYSSDRCVLWNADSPPWRVNDLLFPSFRGDWTTAACPSSALQWLRRRFMSAAGTENCTPTRRFYIPRAPGGWRCVLNDAEVIAWCDKVGIEVIHPHSFTMLEQIQLFAQAKLIIGLHGAGLTNLLFAPHANILELFGAYGDGTWFGMAHRLGHRYASLSCRSVGDDVVVEIEALEKSLLELD